MKSLPWLVLIMFLLGFFALVYGISITSTKLVKIKREYDSIVVSKNSVAKIANEINDKKEKVALLKEVFPQEKDLGKVVMYIDLLGTKSDVVTTVHFESDDVIQAPTGESVVPVSINTIGKYSGVTQFIGNLQKGRYFFTLRSVEGQASKGLSDINTIIIKGDLYVQQ